MPGWDKQYLLNESKTFCMYPWISVHKTPAGLTGPCCVGVIPGSASDLHTVEEIANGKQMCDLRLDMLNGVKNPICSACHSAEEIGNPSPRTEANRMYADYIDVLDQTTPQGDIPDFKYRYLDIRFSNLCNMKCRSCFNGYSSQWEIEDVKNPHKDNPEILVKNFDQQQMLDSVIRQIPNIDRAYFAGGEPLITEQHYVILKEFIRQGNTGVQITYNTNLSNLNYKDEDLVSLWKQFDQHVMVFASLDHYGERAQYIRHGTDWDRVEKNYRRLHDMVRNNEIFLAITTTVTALNYPTLWQFVEYIYEQDLVPNNWQLNFAQDPKYLCAYVLPEDIKADAGKKLAQAVQRIREKTGNPDELSQFLDMIKTVNKYTTWDEHSDMFVSRMQRLDRIRTESLDVALPELAELYNE